MPTLTLNVIQASSITAANVATFLVLLGTIDGKGSIIATS